MCTSFGLNESLVPDLVQIIRNHQPQIWLSHDAGDVLLALRVRGWRTAILTNGIPSAQAAKVLTQKDDPDNDEDDPGAHDVRLSLLRGILCLTRTSGVRHHAFHLRDWAHLAPQNAWRQTPDVQSAPVASA